MTTIPQTVIDAILACDVGALTKEQAAALVEGWIEKFEKADRAFQIVAVEQPWAEWGNDNTLIVGVKDMQAVGFLGEWKTHKAPRRKKDGDYYQGEGPMAWAQEMAASIQLSLYARPDTSTDFLIRAAIKNTPPEFWEFRVTISAESAQLARHCIAVQADIIRAARKHDAPWRFKDNHGVYGRQCPCTQDIVPVEGKPFELISPDDPGAAAVKSALDEHPERNTSELVVLSASAYQSSVQCLEKYRRSLCGEKEDSEALDIGTAFHAGLSGWYKFLKDGG